MELVARIAMAILSTVMFVWDVVTLPIYFLIYRPWQKRRAFRQIRSRRIATGENEVTYRGIDRPSPLKEEILNHKMQITTLDKVFDFVCGKYKERRSLGVRKILREEQEKGVDGKTLTKYILGNYSWQTYNQVQAKSEAFGRGLRSLGLQQREKLVVYADTRPGWFVAAMGCFKFNFPLVTIYTNLGESGVQFGIGQTKAEFVLVSQELLPKLYNVLHELPHVKALIVFEDLHKGPVPALPKGATCELHLFEDIVELGQASKVQVTPPLPDDPAIIMYTSGSTGNPKGVILSHGNLVNALLSLLVVATSALGPTQPDDVYIAYLPLAHVLELLAEFSFMILGIGIGYSSPFTLTDTSLKIKKGQKGDATLLRPTVMCAVPVILDRIYKGINKKIDEGGEFKSKLVNFLIKYRAQWKERGYDTPIANALVFNKMKAVVGGRVRMIVSGGAPLSEEAHQFIRTCLCVNLHQGYGLTETGAVACITDETDISTGRVGPPLSGVDIKLVNWDEGGYHVTDNVGPRGEIVIGGLHVAKGYYEMAEQTARDFYDENGKRWFKTGDIAQVMPDGTFKIIDRKKDLVKLQMGEYVSLGKVESTVKLHEIIETICVCARSAERSTVALVIPDQFQLEKLSVKLNKGDLSRTELCKDNDVIREVLKMISSYGLQMKLERFEIPKAVTLIDEPWTPESGLVTAALKIKRPAVDSYYKSDIDQMYDSINKEFSASNKQSQGKLLPA